MTRFILVGAEGMGEMDLKNNPIPGIRAATADEEAAFTKGLEELCRQQENVTPRDYFVDGTGRPYWLVAVGDEAPASAKTKAEKYKRCVRLFD